jgi:hypothetical protein
MQFIENSDANQTILAATTDCFGCDNCDLWQSARGEGAIKVGSSLCCAAPQIEPALGGFASWFAGGYTKGGASLLTVVADASLREP